jgi:hypothetical protein
MRVSVYELRHGDDVKVGELRFDGRTVTASADSPTLRFILAHPCRGPKGERLTARDNPKEFLANLHRQYRSAYLRCGVEGGGGAPPQDEDKGGLPGGAQEKG